ncbi:MAG: hypothetical protein AAFV86_23055 [Pseudomonadota bacterium]
MTVEQGRRAVVGLVEAPGTIGAILGFMAVTIVQIVVPLVGTLLRAGLQLTRPNANLVPYSNLNEAPVTLIGIVAILVALGIDGLVSPIS